ncbi:hypothetical protein JOF56_004552 [Kibdelosporangium banguiense]|uniref:Uncharacterized protein n=1 Tax=Kibdelosporangium banguiense TaxID=1365924 RepID=A0ABS4TIB7_9PSEU|nr:hypothetical protein [Kibdelosporangium banguiense]MBP2324167.1 hypothetical protein [Kibdelosporangium banguiense]
MSVLAWQAVVAVSMSLLLSICWLVTAQAKSDIPRQRSRETNPPPETHEAPDTVPVPAARGPVVEQPAQPPLAGLRFEQPDIALMQRVLDGLRKLPTEVSSR